MNSDAALQLAGWVYLPNGAATGAIATAAYNIRATHTSNPGEWLINYIGPGPMVAGEYLLSMSNGAPSDNHDAVCMRLTENGDGPGFQANIVGYDSSPEVGWFTTNDTPYHLILWRLPKLS